jgi:hypothetical protein
MLLVAKEGEISGNQMSEQQVDKVEEVVTESIALLERWN